jgi:hypothetical protein
MRGALDSGCFLELGCTDHPVGQSVHHFPLSCGRIIGAVADSGVASVSRSKRDRLLLDCSPNTHTCIGIKILEPASATAAWPLAVTVLFELSQLKDFYTPLPWSDWP